ncbi:MAG: hypothetical protein AAF735_00105 [Myxococcota bacterium]
MTRAKISEIKSRLSAFLGMVRRGQTVTILDRKEPIARIVPFVESPTVVIREPADGAAGRLRRRSKVKTKRPVDVVELLNQERGPR